MKEVDFLPTEFKLDGKDKDKAPGRYLIDHPLIKNHFFSVDVYDDPEQERISITLVILVSANKKIFRNATRYPTFIECCMIRESFFYQGEEVIQYIKENPDEIDRGHYFANLICKKVPYETPDDNEITPIE